MAERHQGHFAWVIAVTAGLAGSMIACSKEEPPPATAGSAGNAQVFRFAPPDGTEYTRTDRRNEEVAIVGAPVRRTDSEELRWKTRVERKGDEYEVKQDLVYISLMRDGESLAQGEVPEGIAATLVIGNDGSLKNVKGLEKTAEIFRSLVAPGQEAKADQIITADALSELVAARYKLLFGDTIGRPAAPGSTWTITHPPGSLITSRTVTVTGHEACGATTCARLKVDFKLDPNKVTSGAVSMVKASVSAAGEDPSQVTVKSANYDMTGWMLIEPATMLSHGASLNEQGTVTVADSAQTALTIEIKGRTDLIYAYGEARTSQRSPRAESPLASE
jgi:hypothetical protein